VIPAPKRERIGSLGPASVFPRPPKRLGTLATAVAFTALFHTIGRALIAPTYQH
jgi:hypothetical protein